MHHMSDKCRCSQILDELEAAHDEGYDRGLADAERAKNGLTPNRYNPFRSTRRPETCPACGSREHDGSVNPEACPEDWMVLSKFEARRRIQLTCERANEEFQ